MNSITFECKTITPMLMHGANGKSAELRPASIKGILRFWWRAIHGNLSLEELHKQEGEIFGSMDKRSSFSIRIKPKKLNSKSHNALPHRPKPVNLNGFDTNQTFEVIISGQNLELIQNLFILSTTLGGFGQRSRRGFGSVQITKIDNINFTPPTTEQEIKAKIADTFKYTSQINYPYIQEIKVGKTYDNFEALLTTIGTASHNNNCDELGYAKGKERLSSPVYVSVIRDGTDYRPVITTLKNTKSDNTNEKVTLFKGAING